MNLKPFWLLSFWILCFSALRAQDFPNGPAIIAFNGQGSIFPSGWTGGKTKAIATEADTVNFREDTIWLLHGMYKYPESVLTENIKNIYFVGKLFFNRQRFTGTNSFEDIYIANIENPDIEKTFHHEFSSILLRRYPDDFLEYNWRSLSPGLKGGNSASAVKSGLFSTGYDSLLLTKGYLSPYSLSNWENDFNMYAENLFAGGKKFWSIVDHYPAVKRKTELILKFYASVWNGFSEHYFRGIAETDEKSAQKKINE